MSDLCIDLCCGLGGWSDGFADAGFDVLGIDINPQPKYRHPFWQADIRKVRIGPGIAKVITASPPCTEFSYLTAMSAAKGSRGPPDPEGPLGMGLVREVQRIVREARPDFWIMENVQGAIRYIPEQPRIERRPWYFWGDFPDFLFPTSNRYLKGATWRFIPKGSRRGGFHTKQQDERGYIPRGISRPFAEACKRPKEARSSEVPK